jgi:multidrug resistance efflux pump
MKKLLVGGVLAVMIAGGSVFGFMSRQGAPAVVEAAEVAPREDRANQILVEGKVVPIRTVSLGMATGGRVTEVAVAEGAQVAAGQVLARVDAARQTAAVAQAEAGLRRAEARVQQLKAGARPQELAAAQAALDAAQAQLARIQQGARPEDIRAAEAALSAAQASLAKLQEGAGSGQLIAARTEVLNAGAVLQQAQAAYDKVKGNPDIGALPQSVQLQQATNAYNAAKARLADLEAGATNADLAGAGARVRQAQAQLDALKAAARPAEIAAAEAEVRRAAAQLALVREGPRSEEIAIAEADVAAAQAALDQARAALADTELRAPFAGTVAELNLRVGEQAAPGASAVTLADFSAWVVETTDLTELNVVRVQPGDTVTISLDAAPGLELAGEVVRINPVGRDQRGDVSYTAELRPLQTDPRLRWNMTAAVAFNAK